MIINKLVFPVKLDGSFVEGSIPSAHLTANSINRDMFYVISPKPQDTIVCANFQNSLQSGEPDTVVMLPSEIEVNELVSKDASYYELIKEWNVWQGFLPSLALEKVAFDRASPLGISFSFKQLIKPKLPNLIGYEYQGVIDSENFIPSLNGYYYIGLPYYEVAGISFTKNDLLIKTSSEIIRKQAIIQKSNTGTLTYSVDPSVMDGVFEEVKTSLTDSIVSSVSEIKQDLKLIKLTFRNYYTRDETYNRLEIDSSLGLLELKDQEQDQRLDNIESVIGNGGGGNGYEPDGITIVLNEDDKLEVNLKDIMNGGYL